MSYEKTGLFLTGACACAVTGRAIVGRITCAARGRLILTDGRIIPAVSAATATATAGYR